MGVVGGYFIGYIIGIIIVSVIFGCITRHINESKGYEGGFAWGFWLGIIGIIVVACKSDNQSYSQETYRPMPPSAQTHLRTWRCVCGQENTEGLDYCTFCHRERYCKTVQVSEHINVLTTVPLNDPTNNYCHPYHETLSGTCMAVKALETVITDNASVNKSCYSDTNAQKKQIEIIKKLSELHRDGILTDEEYNTKKAELLSKI